MVVGRILGPGGAGRRGDGKQDALSWDIMTESKNQSLINTQQPLGCQEKQAVDGFASPPSLVRVRDGGWDPSSGLGWSIT